MQSVTPSQSTMQFFKTLFASSAFLAVASAAWAQSQQPPQAEPGVDAMIRQLQPGPRTRGLGRNLVVSPADAPQAPGGEAATSRPSLSLQIQFDFDSDRVRSQSLPLVHRLADALRSTELARARFSVEGHTDARGRADYNQRLSERRANAVRALLVADGVEPQRLEAVGKGSSEPANAVDPTAAENRRVRVVNLD